MGSAKFENLEKSLLRALEEELYILVFFIEVVL